MAGRDGAALARRLAPSSTRWLSQQGARRDAAVGARCRYSQVLGVEFPKSKKVSRSNWANKSLSMQQVKYAAMDVFAAGQVRAVLGVRHCLGHHAAGPLQAPGLCAPCTGRRNARQQGAEASREPSRRAAQATSKQPWCPLRLAACGAQVFRGLRLWHSSPAPCPGCKVPVGAPVVVPDLVCSATGRKYHSIDAYTRNCQTRG